MSAPNMEFLCLILWLGEACTDANDADANDAQRTKHDCIGLLGIMPNEPKITGTICMPKTLFL